MSIKVVHPSAELADFVDSLGVYEIGIPSNHIFLPGLIGLNPCEFEVTIDGVTHREPVMFCAIADPASTPIAIERGPVFYARMRGGGFDRLLDIDPLEGSGVTVPDRTRHQALIELGRIASRQPDDWEATLLALDRYFSSLIASAKPKGLAERYVCYVREKAGDLTIAEAVTRLACSARTLERACRQRYGRSPKRIARSYRAAATFMRELDSGERPETDPDFAYADLPHYSNDLRDITGLTRTEHLLQAERDRSLPLEHRWIDGRIASSEADMADWRKEQRDRIDAAFS